MPAASEHTPLIATIRARPAQPRYPHNLLRRFCAIACSSTLFAFFIACIVYLLVAPADHLPGPNPGRPPLHGPGDWLSAHLHGHGRTITYEQLKEILLQTPSSENAEAWSKYYTAGPHLSGQNYSQADWTRQRWESWGVKSHIATYETYLNYPLGHRLALLTKNGTSGKTTSNSSWTVAYEASLEEDVLPEDPTTALEDRVPTFHGYSASGNVTASVVYVNYGTYQDFQDLLKADVPLKGNIAIARYGGVFRGLKVKRAQELGMVGVVLYSDPGDDGDNTEEKGVAPYPEGPARQPSSVQRGSVQFLSTSPGDPTTPGYPSKPGVPRQPVDGAIPHIPSIPISYLDAIPILKALNGHGPKAEDMNKWWTRNTGLGYKGVDYNIGPTPSDVVVNLCNEQNYTTTPIWNVLGVINGSIHDEVIIVGNHRDSWIAGGASDPNSGSAVLNEVIRSFGEALRVGWKPFRTIVFASWDGEEPGLLGSTEWVEEHLPWLKITNAAYVNADTSVAGPRFTAHAAPLLQNVIRAVVADVQSPNQTKPGQTVGDVWDGLIKTIGSGGDFTAFQDHAGIPCLDVGFDAGKEDPVYHYHSNYDTFHWMSTYADPGFRYHRAMAQVVGLMTAKLADEPVLPFSAGDYAKALEGYIKRVEDRLDAVARSSASDGLLDDSTLDEDAIAHLRASTRRHGSHDTNQQEAASSLSSATEADSFRESLKRLHHASARLQHKAARLDEHAAVLRARAEESIPWWKWPKKLRLALAIRRVNTKYKFLERSFLYDEGLDGRPWFKHVIFAPGLWTGYAGAVLPGLEESIDDEKWDNAERWVGIIEKCLRDAAHML